MFQNMAVLMMIPLLASRALVITTVIKQVASASETDH